MPYSLNIALVLQDPVARDMTRVRLSQRVGLTSLTAAVDSVTTSIPLASYSGVSVGRQLLVEAELMTVTAAPAAGPITVVRGDTSILTTTGAAAHAVGASVYLLQYPDLASMGVGVAQADVMSKIVALGANSETLTGMATA